MEDINTGKPFRVVFLSALSLILGMFIVIYAIEQRSVSTFQLCFYSVFGLTTISLGFALYKMQGWAHHAMLIFSMVFLVCYGVVAFLFVTNYIHSSLRLDPIILIVLAPYVPYAACAVFLLNRPKTRKRFMEKMEEDQKEFGGE